MSDALHFPFDTDGSGPLFPMDGRSVQKAYRMAGHLKAIGDAKTRMVSFRASTPRLDRHGTIVRTEGILTDNFKQNPIFAWNHNAYDMAQPDDVLGKVVGWQQDENRFDIDVRFANHPKAQAAFEQVQDDMLRMVSIGFIAGDAGYEAIDGQDEPVWVYRTSELLEVSLVVLPSNADAAVITNSFGPRTAQTVTPPGEQSADIGAMFSRAKSEIDAIRAMREWRLKR